MMSQDIEKVTKATNIYYCDTDTIVNIVNFHYIYEVEMFTIADPSPLP